MPVSLLRSALTLALMAAPTNVFADQACIDDWTKNIQPIANRYCVACHQNAAPAGKLTLQRGGPPANLINIKADQAEMPYVTPGDPEQSYLFRKLSGTHLEAGGTGAKMPLGGKLGEADLAAIEAWIKGCVEPAPVAP
jgi:hypothetical protein